MNRLLILVLLLLFTIEFSASILETYQDNIPDNIQLFLNKHFKLYEVDKIKYDADDEKYTIKYKCEFEVELDSKGNWLSLKRKYNPLPKSVIELLHINTINYIAQKYSNKPIIRIKRKSSGYKITLSDKSELLFDSQGFFIKGD